MSRLRGQPFFVTFVAALVAAIATFLALPLDEHPGARDDGEKTPSVAAALQFLGEQRVYPSGTIDLAAVRRAYATWMQAMAEPASADSGWRSIGPSNLAGRVLAVAVNPPSEIWVGTASGGLWKLLDSGNVYHWMPIETGFPTQSVGAIYIDSSNPKLLFIGTGEVYSYYRTGAPGTGVRTYRGFYGSGIYRSTNDGAKWESVLSFPDSTITAVHKIIANPRHAQSMYAATTEGIYKSYDHGVTWEVKLPVKMAMDLVINRVDTTRVFAACGDQSGLDAGIYRSTDGGEHWSHLAVDVHSPTFTGRSAVAINATNPRIVYAGVSDQFGMQGLYQSTDEGDTWSIQNTADYTRFQGWYTNVVEVNPLFFGEVLCGGVELWKSTNDGSNLAKIDALDRYHVDIHAITYQRADPNLATFYLGTDGGIFKSRDRGGTFKPMNDGFVSTQFYNGFVNAAGDSELAIGGIQDNGTWKYSGSSNWQSLQGGDGSWCAFAAANPNVIIAQYVFIDSANPAHTGVQVVRSTNAGTSFRQVFMDTSGPVSFTTPIIAAPTAHTMYLGTDSIFKSTDDGLTWTSPSHSTLDPFVAGANTCIALAVSHSTADTVYAATAPITHAPGVFRSVDGGATWTTITGDSLPNRYPTHLAVDARDAGIAYVTFSGFGAGHAYRTTDAGAHWQSISGGLPDLPTNCLLPDPLDRSILYLGNDLGVYVSTNAGASWMPFSVGMPAAVVMSITITSPGRLLRAATHGRGVYERHALPPSGDTVGIGGDVADNLPPMGLTIFPTVMKEGDVLSIETGESSSAAGMLTIYDAGGKKVAALGQQDLAGRSNRGILRLSINNFRNGAYLIEYKGVTGLKRGRFLVLR